MHGMTDIVLCFLIVGTDPESEMRGFRYPDYRWLLCSRPTQSKTVNYLTLLFSVLDNHIRDYEGVIS